MSLKSFKEVPYINKDMEGVRQRALKYIKELENIKEYLDESIRT